MFSFGSSSAKTKEEDIKESIKRWTGEIKAQSRGMDRQIRGAARALFLLHIYTFRVQTGCKQAPVPAYTEARIN